MTVTTRQFIELVRERYGTSDFIPLHAPQFHSAERDALLDCLESTFVSTVGRYVSQFEEEFAAFVNAPRAVAVVNGTAALHIALRLAGVQQGDLVLTQAMSFVAACNAISYCGAQPLFADVDAEYLGLSPKAVDELLGEIAVRTDGCPIERTTGKVIRACVPMHAFGHPVDLDALASVCRAWKLPIVEDAAEAVGSTFKGRHVGQEGLIGAFSFNGNKIITTGGGGMVTFRDTALAQRARHLTTTAKISHAWEFSHDEVGYNYRMPNINAALGCGQMKHLPAFLKAKRALAVEYDAFFDKSAYRFCREREWAESNYWLCAVMCADKKSRDAFLKETNAAGVGTRPAWTPMHRLPMYASAPRGPLTVTEFIADHLVNLPSSPVLPR